MSEYMVRKFGGTSMAIPGHVAEIVGAHEGPQMVVVSAPGGDETTNLRTTNELRKLAKHIDSGDTAAANEIVAARTDRFAAIYDRAFGADMGRKAGQIASESFRHLPHHGAGQIIGLGEIITARCMAVQMGGTFIWPDWIRFGTDGTPLSDQPEFLTDILQDADRPNLLFVPGFIGFDGHGFMHTIGAGASDQTGGKAARIAGTVFGDHNVTYENWTDVDGILSGNPKVVDRPQTIPELTHREVREGAHGGTGVLQGDTIVDLDGSKVVTVIKNTKNPTHPGSRVVVSRDASQGDGVVAITGRDDLVEIVIDDLGMAPRIGYTEEVLEVLREQGLSYEHSPTSRDFLGLTIHNNGSDEERAERAGRIDAFIDKIRSTRMSPTSAVEVNERGVVYMIGEQLRDPVQQGNTLIRALGAASQANIPIYGYPSTSSSPSLALLVDRANVNPLIRRLHAQEIEHSIDLFGRPHSQ